MIPFTAKRDCEKYTPNVNCVIDFKTRIQLYFYYEQQITRELKGIHICGCRCNERLKVKTDGSMFFWWIIFIRIQKGGDQGVEMSRSNDNEYEV